VAANNLVYLLSLFLFIIASYKDQRSHNNN